MRNREYVSTVRQSPTKTDRDGAAHARLPGPSRGSCSVTFGEVTGWEGRPAGNTYWRACSARGMDSPGLWTHGAARAQHFASSMGEFPYHGVRRLVASEALTAGGRAHRQLAPASPCQNVIRSSACLQPDRWRAGWPRRLRSALGGKQPMGPKCACARRVGCWVVQGNYVLAIPQALLGRRPQGVDTHEPPPSSLLLSFSPSSPCARRRDGQVQEPHQPQPELQGAQERHQAPPAGD